MGAITLDDRGVVMPCAACGQKNRTPYARLAETGTCGKCGADLPPPGEPIEVGSDAAFYQLTRESALPVFVDFWAAWCGPCRAVAPEVEKLARMEQGRLIVAKVDTEALRGVASRYNIRSIPTMMLFRGGETLDQTMGAQSAAALQGFVRAARGE